jgi:hypothetical protein
MHRITWWHRWGRTGAIGIAAGAIAYFAFGRHQEVPLLDWFDLGIHEAGHLLGAWLPEIAMFIAGSFAQVAFPLVMAAYFGVRRRDPAAAGLCLVWAGASAWDVSVYAGDAIAQRLPLVGGGQHDWAYILQHFDAIHLTSRIASGIEMGGMALAFAGFTLITWAVPVGLSLRSPVPVAAPRRVVAGGADPWVVASQLPFHHGKGRAQGVGSPPLG